MKHRLTLLMLLPLAPMASLHAGDAQEVIVIARDGKTDYTIVQSNRATEPEKFAVEELATFLKRVRIFETDADDPAVNEWGAYISLKLQGPAYVKGSTHLNGAWMDRVLLIRPQEQDQAICEIQQ